MKKISALILCCCLLTACGDGDKKSVLENIEILSVAEGEIGEIITPDENDKDYDLGEYRYSHDGTKLYFNEDEYPKELIFTLEKYFESFAENDFEKFKSCLHPLYIAEMENFLEENYSYGLDQSFQNQRESLTEKMGGEFKITRLRVEKTADNTDEFIEEFFTSYDEIFENNFYEEIKNNIDNFYYMTFFVMAENEKNEEILLLSEYEIVFAEKDGVYCTFG